MTIDPATDSDTTTTPNPILQATAASLIQRLICGNISRCSQLSTTRPIIPRMTSSTDYEFPGFKVAIDLASPVLNTDGLSAGRLLYKKEICPKEGSKEEKELLTDIKADHYPKYKVMIVSLKDPEKLASNLSIFDNLTYTEQLMIEFNMEDPFRICFPNDLTSLATLEVDAKSKRQSSKISLSIIEILLFNKLQRQIDGI